LYRNFFISPSYFYFWRGAFLIRAKFYNYRKKKFMGKGDKKTKKGKIFKGSFGKSRPANVKKAAKKK